MLSLFSVSLSSGFSSKVFETFSVSKIVALKLSEKTLVFFLSSPITLFNSSALTFKASISLNFSFGIVSSVFS